MNNYLELARNAIGKRFNRWTFIAYEYKEKTNNKFYNIIFMICKCDCGQIRKYTSYACFGTNQYRKMPYECKKCRMKNQKRHLMAARQLEDDFYDEYIKVTPAENKLIVAEFENVYKKYYRD